MPFVVLGGMPLLLLAINVNWIFSDTGLIDAWLYHGYFHSYPEYVSRFFPHVYYGTRLAWILPGYAAYHLLPPHAANLALHLLFYYASVAALYRAAAILTSRSAALISAAAFGTAIPTLVAYGWDYVDVSVITYTLIALWAIVEGSISSRRTTLLFIAGAAAACIVHSNLAAILLVPAVVICYWCCHERQRWLDPLVFALGGLTVTGLMSVVNLRAGGRFLFFMGSVQWAVATVGTQPYIPVPPLQWPGSSRYVVPLIGACAATGAFLTRRTRAARAALLMTGWLYLSFLAYDLLVDGGLLQIQYYVSWFLPLAAIGVAAAIGPVPLTTPAATGIALGIVAVQASVLADVPQALHRALLNAVDGWWVIRIELAMVGAALLTAGVVAARARRPGHIAVLAAAAVLANAIAAPNLDFTPSASSRSQFDAVQQTLAFIRTHVPRGTQPLFWIPSDSPRSSFYHSLASTHLYLGSLVSLTYPRLHDDSTDVPKGGSDLEPGDYLIIASDSRPDRLAVADELRRVNLNADTIAWATVHTETVSFVLTLLHIQE